MKQTASFAILLALSIPGFIACGSPRQNCYEENRCDSASMECMGITSMLINGSSTIGYSFSYPGTDGTSNGTISGADWLSAYDTTVVSGSLSTGTDAFDVYYISSYTSSLTINASVSDTVGSPACYGYTTPYASSNTSADPKVWADSNLTSAGGVTATGTSISVPYFGYAYIVCKAGTASDNYKLTTRAVPGSSSMSTMLLLMCAGAGQTCRATCNTQFSY